MKWHNENSSNINLLDKGSWTSMANSSLDNRPCYAKGGKIINTEECTPTDEKRKKYSKRKNRKSNLPWLPVVCE